MGCMETQAMTCHRGVPSSPCHPSHASLVVTVALAVLAGLVAQWSEEEQKHQRTISIPLETYEQGCIKDVEEGLEVKLSPWAACLLSTLSLFHHYSSLEPFWAPSECDRSSSFCLKQSCPGLHGAGAG